MGLSYLWQNDVATAASNAHGRGQRSRGGTGAQRLNAQRSRRMFDEAFERAISSMTPSQPGQCSGDMTEYVDGPNSIWGSCRPTDLDEARRSSTVAAAAKARSRIFLACRLCGSAPVASDAKETSSSAVTDSRCHRLHSSSPSSTSSLHPSPLSPSVPPPSTLSPRLEECDIFDRWT